MATSHRFALGSAVLLAASIAISAQSGRPDWIRFRGPNGSGVSSAKNIPTEFGPGKNVAWRVELPIGYSSPILFGDRIFLTGVRDNKTLVTMALDRSSGKILWERPAPAEAKPPVDKRNNPASPSVAVETNSLYVFFPDYGLVTYDQEGKELWKLPLGPFNNIYGMGASPVIHGDLLLLAVDQSRGSYLAAFDKKTGKERWKTPRPEATSGHATPIIWRAPDGKDQILLPGSFLLTAYDPADGKKLWWVRGLSWEIKSTPVIANGIIYINGYGSPEGDPGRKIVLPAADEAFATADADKNGTLSRTEFPRPANPPANPPTTPPNGWFAVADLDQSGEISKNEWEYIRAALESENGMLAIRLGGSGDMTDKSIVWKYHRSVPQLPSPLIINNVLYMVNDGGIVTTFNAATGEVIKQGRLTGALGNYFASPVAADGHVFFTSQPGVVAVLNPDGDLAPIVVNPLNEDVYATPAFADGRLYVRTVQALWAFGK
ncbi:MAG TPA: PQQ-binding-like beta-propeller repeat protein [Vicinamibacterales bacterium]|nr:PQQ-binding-like beta-propeller repeat protein [Vicinamibacterales bacterium]